jgi:hypothetical protein
MKSVSVVISLPLHRSTVVESTLCSRSEYSEVCRVWDCRHKDSISTVVGDLLTGFRIRTDQLQPNSGS